MVENDLKARIEAAKAKLQEPNGRVEQNRAWQFLSEIVAGLLVGGGIGWLLDGWIGSKPWLFIVFILLGIAGAFWNMMRLASRDEIVHIHRD